MSLEKEFASHEQAVALKELGFDEPCFKWYTAMGRLIEAGKSNQPDYLSFACSAPLKQQVFRWFRENYTRLYTDLFVDDDQTFGYAISYFISEGRVDKPYKRQFTTYEQAEDACINQLIELAKQQSSTDDTLSKQQDNG